MPAGVRSTGDLRRRNRADIFRAVVNAGDGTTRQDLGERTGLAAATVSLVVSELTRAGVLQVAGSLPARSGRPPALVSVNPARGCVVGVDVAETYVSAQSFDLGLTPGTMWRGPAAEDGTDLVEACVDAVSRVVPEGLALLGLGVSVPGLVDPSAGRVVRSPDGRIVDLALAAALSRRLALPAVHLDNPLRASVIGELWAGLGRREPDLAVVTLGTGVGAGFAIEGQLRRGGSNLAGEWGHIPVEPDGRRCRCGRQGCLEAYIGAPGILETARQHGLSLPTGDAIGAGEEAGLRGLTRLLAVVDDPGHRSARAVVSATAARLGDGLTTLRHLIDPSLVVVGGWVCDVLAPWLLPPARAHAEERVLPGATMAGWLQQSELGARQVATGAAGLALIDVIDRVTG